MIRSAKMKLTTPPKLIPPFHRTPAKGTLPIEHTKVTTATRGPITGPQSLASEGMAGQEQMPPEPIRDPGADRPGEQQADDDVAQHGRPFHDEDVRHRREPLRLSAAAARSCPRRRCSCPWRHGPPSAPARPSVGLVPGGLQAAAGAGTARNRTATKMIIKGPPTNSAKVNCQPSSRARMIPSSMTRLVEAISNAMAAREAGAFAEQRSGQRHRSIGTRRAGRAQAGGDGQRSGRSSPSRRIDRLATDDGLDNGRQGEAQDERPQDLPGHGSGQTRRRGRRRAATRVIGLASRPWAARESTTS